MTRTRCGGPAAALLLVCATFAAPATAAEAPSDEAVLPNLAFDVHQEVDVGELVALWARRFGALAVIDPALRPLKVRFVTPVSALTWRATKLLLEFHDVIVVESQPVPGSPWLIRAHHRNTAPAREPAPYPLVDGPSAPATGEVVTAVFQVKHGAAASILQTVSQIWRRDPTRLGTMFHVPGPELIIVVDQATKVRYYGQLIEALDVAGPRRQHEVVSLRHARAEQLAPLVTQALATLTPQTVQPGAPLSVPPQVLADPRTNQLIVAGSPVDLPAVRALIDELDVRVGAPQAKVHVYRCKDVDAQHLATTLNGLLTGPGATAPAPGAAPASAGASDVPTRIVADTRKNALLIQAEDPAFRQLLALLAELDQKPRRVMIEAEVWEVSTPTDQLSIGVELAGLTSAHDGSTRPAGATAFGLSTLQVQQDAQGNPVSLGRLPTLGAGLTAVVTRDTFNRIPLVLNMIANFEEARLVTKSFAATNDNEAAKFKVALSQPFLKNSFNQVAASQEVEFVDASTTLDIKPQVNSDEYLTLELNLELSSFSGSGSANLPPGKSSRSYSGKITVPNGRYVAFGGLEQETERQVEDKVPFAGDIPILGHLFKNWTRSRTRTRVYIFIRPVIFTEDSFAPEQRLADHLRRAAHLHAGRDDWLPPVVPAHIRLPGWDLQDEAFERFGHGSADPFGAVRH